MSFTLEDANKLSVILKRYCPIDSGALKGSITQAEEYVPGKFLITIGNDGSAINGTSTNQYASITNDATSLTYTLKDGRKKVVNNPNYGWVNRALQEWANEIVLTVDNEEEDI